MQNRILEKILNQEQKVGGIGKNSVVHVKKRTLLLRLKKVTVGDLERLLWSHSQDLKRSAEASLLLNLKSTAKSIFYHLIIVSDLSSFNEL